MHHYLNNCWVSLTGKYLASLNPKFVCPKTLLSLGFWFIKQIYYLFTKALLLLNIQHLHKFLNTNYMSTRRYTQPHANICAHIHTGVYILPLFPFFKSPEKTLPQGYFFFFTIVKFGEVFQEGGGEFFQDIGRIYTPAF